MKTVKTIVLLVGIILLGTFNGMAQRGRGNHHPNGNARVVRGNHAERKMRPARVIIRSPYRPAKMVVYYPHWRPNYGYHRRWVYFPRYNFYWDNWRQGYYYMNGPTWVFNATPPPVIVNVNLEKETNYELNESQDDVDDVYRTNPADVKELKTDTVK
ncbi:MAG: hypothetical protein HY062_03675 [Bacteroidetes bacterium]|nr:hypothetical protein [Bacteroidota bacterium]